MWVSNSRDPVLVCPNYVVVHGDAYELYERRPHGVIPFSPPLSSPYFIYYLPTPCTRDNRHIGRTPFTSSMIFFGWVAAIRHIGWSRSNTLLLSGLLRTTAIVVGPWVSLLICQTHPLAAAFEKTPDGGGGGIWWWWQRHGKGHEKTPGGLESFLVLKILLKMGEFLSCKSFPIPAHLLAWTTAILVGPRREDAVAEGS